MQPFVYGGVAGMMATVCIQPIDMVKVQIQLAGEGSKLKARANPFQVARTLIKTDGILSFYKGLSAGLLRQVRACRQPSLLLPLLLLIIHFSNAGNLHYRSNGHISHRLQQAEG